MTTLLLTGAGGAALPNLIRHLQESGYTVLVADADEHAAGFWFADKSFVIPRGDDPKWLPMVQDICQREGAQVIIPLVDEELLKATELTAVQRIAPTREFTKLCLDKWELMCALTKAGISCPATNLTWQTFGRKLTVPLVVKPRKGHGSKGLMIYRDQIDFNLWRDHEKDMSGLVHMDQDIIQSLIEGPEYTVSVVCWRDNIVRAVVPKEIICKRGTTHLAVTRHNEKIDAVCRRIVQVFKPGGPFNVQLRLQDGEPYIFEINPRFSGTVNLTIASGADEVGGLVELALGHEWNPPEWMDGLVLTRHYQDRIVPEAYVRQSERMEPCS